MWRGARARARESARDAEDSERCSDEELIGNRGGGVVACVAARVAVTRKVFSTRGDATRSNYFRIHLPAGLWIPGLFWLRQMRQILAEPMTPQVNSILRFGLEPQTGEIHGERWRAREQCGVLKFEDYVAKKYRPGPRDSVG